MKTRNKWIVQTIGTVVSLVFIAGVLTGCATMSSFEKVKPKEYIQRIDSTYISSDNEFILNFVVQINESTTNIYNSRSNIVVNEEVWCATMPFNRIVQNTIDSDQILKLKGIDSDKFINTLQTVTASEYNLTKSKCVISNADTIPISVFDYGYIDSFKLFSNIQAPIVFKSPDSHTRIMDYGFIVFKSDEPTQRLKLSKVELPLPPLVYDKKKLLLLPAIIIIDIVMSPYYLSLALFGT